jgi:hypothetical protein
VFDPDDIEEARGKESRRKPAEQITPRQHRRILTALKKALEQDDRQQFEEIVISALNYARGSEKYERAMKIWDEKKGG